MASLRISSNSQRVKVLAEERPDVMVEGDARVRRDGERTTIDELRSGVSVRVPVGTDIVIGSTSARVDVSGPVGSASIVTESGRIEIDQASSLDARTVSGRVQVGRIGGSCRVRNKSGRIEIGGCAGADVATKSGRISLMHVTGEVKAHCVSGRIDAELDVPADVDAETVSGRVSVRLPADARPHRIDGPDATEAPADANCTVRAMSVSGRVEVTVR